jgi:peptidoglycan/LPS O-acetylase OafA/YrhL
MTSASPAGPSGDSNDPAQRDGRRLPYMPGIDGLRAIAVLAVIVYHAEPEWMTGGFLGVEVFFVISGYLITALLIEEYRATGTLDLSRFWIRRARRLLPALFLLLTVVLVATGLFWTDLTGRVARDIPGALVYLTNWQFILEDVSYFEAFGRLPVLRHLWSLAIEEQFYVVWPLVFLGGMALLRTVKRFGLATLTLAAGSVALMWWLYEPYADPSRVYYGTDTRAAGLLIGAALAAAWRPWTFQRTATRRGTRLLDAIGFLGLGGVAAFLFAVGEFSPFLYQGGLPLLGFATAAVIAVTAFPHTTLSRALASAPLRWIGTRSYGIYLWHWPIFMVTRPGLDVSLDGPALWALRLALTFGIAELSYRFVETPIRRGEWPARRHVRRTTLPRSGIRPELGPIVTFSLVGVLAFGSFLLERSASIAATGNELQAELEAIAASGAVESTVDVPVSSTPSTGTPAPPPSSQAPPSAKTSAATTTVASRAGAEPELEPATTGTTAPPVREASGPSISAIGDSVMLGAAPVMVERLGDDIVIDAQINRKLRAAIDVSQRLEREGKLGSELVVIHLGNNAVFSSSDFDRVMELLRDHPRVVFLTVKVDQPWEEPVNRALAEGVARWDNAFLADWRAVATRHRGFFGADGVHLTLDGKLAYAEFIDAQR